MNKAVQLLQELESVSNEFRKGFNKPISEESLAEFVKLCLELLQDQNVAVGGGVALSLYSEPRLTQDLDLFVMSQDLDSLKALLTKNGFAEGSSFDFKSCKLYQFKRKDRSLDLLVVQNKELEKFLLDSALSSSVFGSKVKVLSLEGLILTKLVSWRPKDKLDLANLFKDSKPDTTVLSQWAKKLKLQFRLKGLTK